jgi:hypothetical protein
MVLKVGYIGPRSMSTIHQLKLSPNIKSSNTSFVSFFHKEIFRAAVVAEINISFEISIKQQKYIEAFIQISLRNKLL